MSDTCTICQVSKVDAFQHLSILIQLFIYKQGETVSKMLPQKRTIWVFIIFLITKTNLKSLKVEPK